MRTEVDWALHHASQFRDPVSQRFMKWMKHNVPEVWLRPQPFLGEVVAEDIGKTKLPRKRAVVCPNRVLPGARGYIQGDSLAALLFDENPEHGLEVLTLVRYKQRVVPELHFWLVNSEDFGNCIELPKQAITPMWEIREHYDSQFNDAVTDIMSVLVEAGTWLASEGKENKVKPKPLKVSKPKKNGRQKIRKIASIGYVRKEIV